MMNDIENKFRALKGVTLSEREKSNMRSSLMRYMHANPAAAAQGSYFSGVGTRLAGAFGARIFTGNPAFAACVLVLMIGFGTSYAAESALPGHPLYAIKTRINEPIQGAFAVSPVAQTQWNAELAFRRLLEAEELAATDKLSVVASADIEEGLELALSRFDTSVTLLEAADDIEATNAQSDLEATLNAHEVVLTALPTQKNSETARIAALVQDHAAKINKKRVHTEALLTATDTPQVKEAALKRKKSAQDAVGSVQQLGGKNSDRTTASSTRKIASEANNDIKAGDDEAQEGRWGKAFGAFQDAVRKAKETKSSVEARDWLKSRFGIVLEGVATTSATSTFKNKVIEEVKEDD
jgi:hypothetical protein